MKTSFSKICKYSEEILSKCGQVGKILKCYECIPKIIRFLNFSSQVLFSISQKLIQHQIYNYTEILKWLREILICRNNFLQKHKDYAYVGSNIRICRQAHIKLEVYLCSVYLPYLNLQFVTSILALSGRLKSSFICRKGYTIKWGIKWPVRILKYLRHCCRRIHSRW